MDSQCHISNDGVSIGSIECWRHLSVKAQISQGYISQTSGERALLSFFDIDSWRHLFNKTITSIEIDILKYLTWFPNSLLVVVVGAYSSLHRKPVDLLEFSTIID